MAAAQTAIRDIRSTVQPAPVTVDRILSEVSRTMNVSVEDIRGKKHSAPISRARQVAIYVVREVVGSLSMDAIGQHFGGRDHSTIVYTIQKVESQMEKDDAFKGLIKDIVKNVSDS
jgi:chromosomal replication initiator protein